jgi:hypothetical protein
VTSSASVCINGHENVAEARYCVVCGAAVTEAVVASGPSGSASSGTALGAGAPSPSNADRQPRRFGRRALVIVGAVVVALAALGGAALLLLTAPAPDLTGLEPDTAAQTLAADGFEVGSSSEDFSTTVPKGAVAEQSPGAGQRARKGSPVDLVISRGPAVVVPDLEGAGIAVATKDLKELTLGVDRQGQVSETVPEGTIMAQQPAAGEQVEEGSEVRLIVSSGPPTTTVTAEVDLTDISLGSDLTECSLVSLLFASVYGSAIVENGSGERISSISGRWTEDPSNGSFFPCTVTATFPDTPTNEDSYRLELSPSDSSDGSGDSYSRSELESNDWVLRYS